MTQWLFEVPEDLRAFLAEVVARLDARPAAGALDAEDALQSGCGYGGRVAGTDAFRFVYFTEARDERWTLSLTEKEIRAVAAGAQRKVAPRVEPIGHRVRPRPSGEAILQWGASGREAMRVQSAAELAAALEGVRALGERRPQAFRLWSRRDDLLRGVVSGGECALQVVWSDGTYARSEGRGGAHEALRAQDVDGEPVDARREHCVAWAEARAVALGFAEDGEIGALRTVATAEPDLVLAAAGGRRGVLADLGPVAAALEDASLAVPSSAGEGATLTEGDEDLRWARELLAALGARRLVELEDEARAARGVAQLLREHGEDALGSHEEAEELAEAIAALPGVGELYASADELREALRGSAG